MILQENTVPNGNYYDSQYCCNSYKKKQVYVKNRLNCFHGSCIKAGGLQCALVNRYCVFKRLSRENHTKGATVHITEMAQTFHIGITW